jgi:signal transduction histidine kinase
LPAQILQDAVGAIAPLARQNGNRLIVHCAANLPIIRIDVVKVRQSLYNLLSNAFKFTKSGTIAVDVAAVTVGGTEYIEWRITDTGIGIALDEMHKLFRPFSQVDGSTTRKYGGTGLGLAISQRFCELMGGAITVVSEPGKGSAFTIRLPYDSPTADASPLGNGWTIYNPTDPRYETPSHLMV